MIVERMGLDRLNPAPYNPRQDLTGRDKEYQALTRSVERWGLVEPLVWNKRTGNLVSGHQRLKVLLDLGETEAEVSVVDLGHSDEAALNIALNKIAGYWDEKRLVDVLSELDATGFDATLTGFTEDELAEKLVGWDGPAKDEGDDSEPCSCCGK